MPGMSAQETSTGKERKDSVRVSKHNADAQKRSSKARSLTLENEDWIWTANKKTPLNGGSNLTRSGSVKDLIYRFDGPPTPPPRLGSLKIKRQDVSAPDSEKMRHESRERGKNQNPVSSEPSEPKTQESSEQKRHGAEKKKSDEKQTSQRSKDKAAVSDPGPHSNLNGEKQHSSPQSEDEPTTPKIRPNPKYQLYLGSNGSNGTSGSNGSVGDGSGPPGGGSNGNLLRVSSVIRGSMESLSSRDWDSMSDKVGGFESPPRVFNSPYSTLSLDYNPINRMSDLKTQEVMSPAITEINLFGLNRSVSPVSSPALSQRTRIPGYDSLTRRRDATPSQLMQRNNQPNKLDFIQELTKQLEDCRRRNQFLEAESIVMEKERNQIRFEMRGLLVNNEDLLRTNTQMQGEMNRLREKIVELESNNNVMQERFKKMEKELKEAREVMVEANTQEYAFNFLQQTLKNKIQDTEEALEKQAQHAQTVSEKLWLTERNLEELELEKETKAKKALELNNTVSRLEIELADALQEGNQARVELSLQQKLRADAHLRVEELEESVLEKDQELVRLTQIVCRLQGEVTDKLSDKEQTLEEEIQRRERVQLQCKQAERTVEDLRMELQTLGQSRDELSKQLKLNQEKIIDLEGDLEELQENEQRWASKHKRALDQSEQLQMKLIQEKDLNDQLECEKAILERQLRDLRSDMEELQNNRVEVDSITRAEIRAKELENTLRAEERNKVVMSNTISKLEKKIHDLTEQMEEEHKISTEQRELMTQRIRSLKRQLNEAEEEASRRDVQHRHTHRELVEERETNSRLQRQLLDQQLHNKRKETRQTLESLRLNLSEEDDDDDEEEKTESESKPTEKQITQV
ncbi:cingulin-like protein 1 isoform X1 [Onychostoma macrolepis]|uniref:cingulin-like protein 1 isoform X1 n=1 Tax=Onychostoma macrolepis TaxID=369639 RepID=UPI00272B7FFE|nr:cingulin-like protein 1 isoform X1 [Onychostoma macrolepis]XP_058614744.1 cingulin-like protein 1 isoform X1 [Onychostoma macrolepis]